MTTIKEEIEERLKKQLVKETADAFSKRVMALVAEFEYGYMEAIVKTAEDSGYEPDKVSKLLTSDLKARLQEEAENLSLIKKTNNRLPI